jgi:hypothetical protein
MPPDNITSAKCCVSVVISISKKIDPVVFLKPEWAVNSQVKRFILVCQRNAYAMHVA